MRGRAMQTEIHPNLDIPPPIDRKPHLNTLMFIFPHFIDMTL